MEGEICSSWSDGDSAGCLSALAGVSGAFGEVAHDYELYELNKNRVVTWKKTNKIWIINHLFVSLPPNNM